MDIEPKVSSAELVEQVVYLVDADHKRELLAHLVRSRDLRQVLVFTRTKHMAARLAAWLDRVGVDSTAIHGDRSQGDRERALEQFKSGEVRVLVATDVAARGLDIEGLPQVVNFELPYHAQDYVHRIGRTGRAGMPGHAISLVSLEEEDQLKSINRLLKKDLPLRQVRGLRARPARGAAASCAPLGCGPPAAAGRGPPAPAAAAGPPHAEPTPRARYVELRASTRTQLDGWLLDRSGRPDRGANLELVARPARPVSPAVQAPTRS